MAVGPDLLHLLGCQVGAQIEREPRRDQRGGAEGNGQQELQGSCSDMPPP